MFAARLPPDRLPISKTHNPFKIAGVDMRSEAGRRFRDLAARVIAEHGQSKRKDQVRLVPPGSTLATKAQDA
jgi:hypothetical protein